MVYEKNVLTVVFNFLVFSVCAQAETVNSDLASMSTENLLKLKNQIEAELIKRGDSSQGLPVKGIYFVSQDLKAGYYRITHAVGDGMYSEADVYFTVEDYQNNVDDKHKKQVSILHEGDSSVINLEEGNVLEVWSNPSYMVLIPDPAWKP